MDTNGHMQRDETPKNVTSVTSQANRKESGVTVNVTDGASADFFEIGFNTAWDVQQRKIDAFQAENEELRERIDELEDELYYEEERANRYESEAAAAWDELSY